MLYGAVKNSEKPTAYRCPNPTRPNSSFYSSFFTISYIILRYSLEIILEYIKIIPTLVQIKITNNIESLEIKFPTD